MTKPAKAKFSPVVHNRKVEEAETKSKEELTELQHQTVNSRN